MRLGIYSDLLYRRDSDGYSTRRAFIRFVTSLPPRVQEVVIFGRVEPTPGRFPYALSQEGVRFVELPYYPSARSVLSMSGALRTSCSVFERTLEDLDAVWVFGPHPLALLFASIARRRKVPLFLGVRQDYPSYVRARLPRGVRPLAMPTVQVLDRAFRRMARHAPTVAVGEELSKRYEANGGNVLCSGFSLVREGELTSASEALGRRWDGELRLLSVTRLDPEKNPLLLLTVLAQLRERNPSWRLAIAGDGPLWQQMQRRVEELDLHDSVELLGEVPNGPLLWELYRESHAFLHVSLTEGLPQVLAEAQAAGLPVVGTAVGGVPAALEHGAAGILIPPANADAASQALERIACDEALRRTLILAGLENASRETLEAQLDRIWEFFAASLPATGASARVGSLLAPA
jgi:glycosyltransferase involved in cell wall biosynthesis